MLDGWHSNRGGLNFWASVDHLLNRAEGARSIFLGYLIGSRDVGVNHGP